MEAKTKNKVIVFGRGEYYKRKAHWLLDHFEIVAFLDNNVAVSDIFQGNVPVYSPSAIESLPRVPIYVMTSVKYVVEIVEQLLSLKVSADMIHLGVRIPPAFNGFEEWFLRGEVEIFVKSSGICLKYSNHEETVNNSSDFFKTINNINKVINPFIGVFASMPTMPANRYWGNPFGNPIDRRYIEDFMRDNRQYITGDVVEIGDSRYTSQFGHDIKNSYVLHVYGAGNTIKGDLATGEGIVENLCDVLICTQTLQFIFDLHSTVKNIYKILKPNGTALITVPGISQLDMAGYKRWGEAWRFTKQSLRQLFEEAFEKNDIREESFGNVKTAVCFLYGMCQEDLQGSDYAVNDEMYPVILTLVCRKRC